MIAPPTRRQTRSDSIRAAVDEASALLAVSVESPRIDAEVLLAHALDRPRAWLLAHGERVLAAAEAQHFAELVEQRRAGMPVAYLTGSREFWSRPFHVTRDTLIPRPETEHVVEAALQRLPLSAPCRAADLGAGSGIIGITIALERPRSRVLATDISPAAIEVARANARNLGADNVEFRHGDWCDALGDEAFDLIASNPPYVPVGDPHLAQGDLRFEPRLALAAGDQGLAAIAALAAQARDHLAPGGWLILEHGFDQARAVADLLQHHGYRNIESVNDLGGRPRIAAARLGNRPR